MPDIKASFNKIYEQFNQFWDSLSTGKKVTLIAAGILLPLAVVTLVVMANKTSFHLLYSQLPQEDASYIVEQLQNDGIPYELSPTGSAIYVPENQVASVRLSLAGQGLPKGGAVGFELFDSQSYLMSDFVQELNYRRALEGELARTIQQMSEIAQARIHIVLPEDSLFADKQSPAKASVVVTLNNGRRLNNEEVQSITYLVSSAVKDLMPENVTIVDTQGRILSTENQSSWNSNVSMTRLEFRQNFEQYLKQKVLSLLEPLVGNGRAFVQVSAEIDFNQEERTLEQYDPEKTAVRSSTKTEEKSVGDANTGGVPGTASNPGLQPGQNAAATLNQKQNETVEYEVSKAIIHKLIPGGLITKLSVAALLDDADYVDDQGKTVHVPRKPEELSKIEELIKKAVGYDEERGDQVIVQNISIPSAAKTAGLGPMDESGESIVSYIVWGGIFFVFLILLLLIVKTLRKVSSLKYSHAASLPAPPSSAALPGSHQESDPDTAATGAFASDESLPQNELADGEQELKEMLQKKQEINPQKELVARYQTFRKDILNKVQTDPQTVGTLLKAWMEELDKEEVE